jgi:glycosyltransferase involved in cell wall biosynthesis
MWSGITILLASHSNMSISGRQNKMRILIAVNNLKVGGAEFFAVRLANALAEDPSLQVYVYNHHPEMAGQWLREKLSNRVTYIQYHPSTIVTFISWKINAVLALVNFPVIDFLKNIWLSQWIKKNKIDIVNSHYFLVDSFVSRLKGGFSLVPTLHGSYEEISRSDKNLFLKNIRSISCRSNAVVYLADKSINIFDGKLTSSVIRKKIYNGLDVPYSQALPSDTPFVFGMIARGIVEKGWDIAIQAFQVLNLEFGTQVQLTLIGGDHLFDRLDPHLPNVICIAKTDDPLGEITKFHVGLLPTYFEGECLPNFIVECFARGVPVVASDVGEIRHMIETPDGQAGTLITGAACKPDALKLAHIMRTYFLDRQLYALHARRTRVAFDKFSMRNCIQQYVQVFRDSPRAL